LAIEEDLAVIERSIRELQIEWEKFFSGVEKRPPSDAKARLEAVIRRHASTDIRNNALRFRYQSLSARYNTFAELWAKRLRALEEGRPVTPRGVRLPPAVAAPSDAESPALMDTGEIRPRPASRPPGEYRVRNPTQEQALVRSLFEQFLEERRKTGESAGVRFDNFEKLIAQQASRILQDKGARAVDFRLETKDGKVSLKAKPVK
jgi:hypothetical protein